MKHNDLYMLSVFIFLKNCNIYRVTLSFMLKLCIYIKKVLKYLVVIMYIPIFVL